jgi:hypothetical protein
MQTFTLDFHFQDKDHTAQVSAIQRLDHIELTVWPRDLELREQFGTLLFHKFPGMELQAPPARNNADSRPYIEAIAAALNRHLTDNQAL